MKERNKYSKAVAHGGSAGWASRLVDGLNVGAVAGLPVAMAAYFWGNRLLPVDLAARAQAEINLFFAVWAVAALAGLWRPGRRMWMAQLGTAGLLFGAIPLLNAATTATHLGVSVAAGLWQVAGFDLVCLALGGAFAACCWRLGRNGQRAPHRTGLRTPADSLSQAGATQ